MLKTRRFGYDGKGQAVLRSVEDLEAAWQAMGGQPLILEGFVPFERELSMLAVRGLDRSTVFYPLVENHHREGILRLSLAPAPDLTPALQQEAESYASRVLDALGYVGVLAIEFFQVEAGCSPTRWPRGSTIRATGPSKARRPASSPTTCAPSAACHSARPRRWAARQCSTSSAPFLSQHGCWR